MGIQPGAAVCRAARRFPYSPAILDTDFRDGCFPLSLLSDAGVGSERRAMEFGFSAVTRVTVGRRWTLAMRRLGRATGRHLAVVALALTASCNANTAGVAGPELGAS